MEDFLEKEVLRMLRLIRSLFKERPLPLHQASELGIKLPIKFLIKKGQLDYLQTEAMSVTELQKKSSLLL